MPSKASDKNRGFYLLTNGIIALEYLRSRIVVPASLRVKDASYTDLSNHAGNRLVLLNSPEVFPELCKLIDFEGSENFSDTAITMPVLFEIETNLETVSSPNNVFALLETKVISLPAKVTVLVADETAKRAFADFLVRFPGESDDEGISIKVTRGLVADSAGDAEISDIEWLKDQSPLTPVDLAEIQRLERFACSVSLVLHHACTAAQREAAAALVGIRSKVAESLRPMVETRNDVVKPVDRLYHTISELVVNAPPKVDPKALAINLNWVDLIKAKLGAKDRIENQILDQIQKFLKSEIAVDEILNLEKSRALNAFVLFLRDSGSLPKFPNVTTRSNMTDVELLGLFLTGLTHSRNELELAYRRPLDLEAYFSKVIADSFNEKSLFLNKSVSGFVFEHEDDVLFLNSLKINSAPKFEKIESSETVLNTDDLVWEVVTQGKVQVKINGMLTTFDSPADFNVVFTSEPKVTSRPRARNQNLEASPTPTMRTLTDRQPRDTLNHSVSNLDKKVNKNSSGQLDFEDT